MPLTLTASDCAWLAPPPLSLPLLRPGSGFPHRRGQVVWREDETDYVEKHYGQGRGGAANKVGRACRRPPVHA